MSDAAAGLSPTMELRALWGGFYPAGGFNTPDWDTCLDAAGLDRASRFQQLLQLSLWNTGHSFISFGE